jgi:inorganic pyrophosphatase
MDHKTHGSNDAPTDGGHNASDKFINVVIDTPKGSRHKFKYEPESGLFRLSKILPEGMMFPYDFGFVPATKGEDGDPIDALVLIEEPTFTGCLVECCLVGVIEAEQRKGNERPERNDRLLAVARASLLYAEITDISKIRPAILTDIEAFFVNYDRLRNVEYKVLGRSGPAKAHEIVSSSRISGGAGGQLRRVAHK